MEAEIVTMLPATTLPLSMARTTVDGPKKQSPPVNTPGMPGTAPEGSALMRRRSVPTPAAFKVRRVDSLSDSGNDDVRRENDLRLIGVDGLRAAVLDGAGELRLHRDADGAVVLGLDAHGRAWA